MTINELENRYADLLSGDNFDRLNLIIKQPNIFSALGIAHYEIRHSNFLAWLLDPKANHGLENIFLTRFLRDIIGDKRVKTHSLIEIPNLLKQQIFVRREWNNIDILIEFEDTVIALENKIYSGEHSNQLVRYHKIIKEHFAIKKQIFVYLTPFGVKSSQADTYSEYGYQQVATHLQDILALYQESLNKSVAIYINDYINNLKMNVMEDSKANEFARKIYKNHRELFDFIFENKPDAASDFKGYMEDALQKRNYSIGSPNKGYVRFLTQNLKNLIPIHTSPNGWPKKESFLFEIDFIWSGKKIRFYPIVSPGDEEVRKLLINAIMGVNNATAPAGKKWATFLHVSEDFDINRLDELERKEIDEFINKFLDKIENIILEVEEALLNIKEEIMTYRTKGLEINESEINQ